MSGKKLLVADDSLTIQKVIKLALSNEDYVIQAVSDGNEALQQLAVFRPDVVLLKETLPGQSAFDVKRAVNAMGDLTQTRFVLMSSAFEKVDEIQAAEVRFHGRLIKPFDPAHLRSVLLEVLAQAPKEKPALQLTPPAPPPPSSAPTQFPHQPPVPPMEPVAATDSPFSLIPPGEDLGDWSTPLAPTELPPLPAPPSFNESENTQSDIKHLTESTIRMSGLDDFEWSVQEPSLKPPPSFLEDIGSSFQVEPPATPMPATPTHSASAAIPPMSSVASVSSLSSVISKEELSREISETIRQELSKLLPEIAEKVIKEEIHKMLSERF
jgi:CheY-like chemotaxis protein